MRLSRVALSVGLAVAMGLPLAGGAQAESGAGRITATDWGATPSTVFTMDPVSGQPTGTLAQGEDGVLTPDGSRVAYIRVDDTCIPQTEGCMYARDLVVSRPDGSGQRFLAEGVQPETNHAPYVAHPDWSPNGKRIVYDSPRGLEWIKEDGSGQEILTPFGSRGTFSPDGRSIAFHRTTQWESEEGWESGSDLYVLDLATRTVRQVTTDHQLWEDPADWSPDGQRLVYTTPDNVRIVDVTTGAVTFVPTTGLSYPRTAVYSPDGTRIAFTAVDIATDTVHTYVYDGTDVRVLADGPVTLTDWIRG